MIHDLANFWIRKSCLVCTPRSIRHQTWVGSRTVGTGTRMSQVENSKSTCVQVCKGLASFRGNKSHPGASKDDMEGKHIQLYLIQDFPPTHNLLDRFWSVIADDCQPHPHQLSIKTHMPITISWPFWLTRYFLGAIECSYYWKQCGDGARTADRLNTLD